MTYFIYDLTNHRWFSFGNWGIPYLFDLDSDGVHEFVNQFPGLHLSWPDVTIYRSNQGRIEVSASLKETLNIADNSHNEVSIIEKKDEILFDVIILTDQYEFLMNAKYKYENGKIVRVDEKGR
jgi:hypothetical protein